MPGLAEAAVVRTELSPRLSRLAVRPGEVARLRDHVFSMVHSVGLSWVGYFLAHYVTLNTSAALPTGDVCALCASW